jgi:hypothetical protein
MPGLRSSSRLTAHEIRGGDYALSADEAARGERADGDQDQQGERSMKYAVMFCAALLAGWTMMLLGLVVLVEIAKLVWGNL